MEFKLAADIALLNGAAGGAILAASSFGLMYFSGKMTGISGITSGLVAESGEDWQLSYVAGLMGSGYVLSLVYPEAFGTATSYSFPAIVASGVLVGFGTRLSNGCTSGHGLMGLSRFSPRSLVAVLTFMTCGAITASVAALPSIQPLLLDSSHSLSTFLSSLSWPMYYLPSALVVATTMLTHRSGAKETSCAAGEPAQKGRFRNFSPLCLDKLSLACGFLFGLGLGVSGMCSTDRVSGFLAPFHPAGWDPSLAAVMGSGVTLLAAAWPWVKSRNVVSICGDRKVGASLQIGATEANMKVDWRLVLGSALFGVGWGLLGVCPGPAWVSFGAERALYSVFVPSMLAGMVLQGACL